MYKLCEVFVVFKSFFMSSCFICNEDIILLIIDNENDYYDDGQMIRSKILKIRHEGTHKEGTRGKSRRKTNKSF